MIKKIFALLLSLLLLFVLVGCNNTQKEPSDEASQSEQMGEGSGEEQSADAFTPTPFSDVNEIDDPISDEEILAIISQIPSDKYEVYPNTHTVPVSATLYKNGEVISIPVDDPRLIQLTNFFNNCVYHKKCSYTQGLYSLEKTEEILSSQFRLELKYEPYGEPASPYGKETTGSDMFVVTDSFTAIAHDRSGYDEENYPYYATGLAPLYYSYNWLELFGF